MIHLTEHLKGIEVPATAYKAKVSGTNWLCLKHTPSFTTKFIPEIQLPEGKWKALGFADAYTIDFDCELYVEVKKAIPSDISLNQVLQFLKTESNIAFRSLLNSKGVRWVNPYGKKPIYSILIYGPSVEAFKRYESDYDKWQAAEQSLIKGKIVVLKEN